MAKAKRGTPCWYELSTSDATGATGFYGHVLGWTVANAGMSGFDYQIASVGEEMVAGMMASPAGATPSWMPYFTVTDCDKAVAAATKAGGTVHQNPTDIPNTGRIAVLADPQGAGFGIIATGGGAGGAYAQGKHGHGCWHELMTTDPKAAMGFYGKLLGWKPGDSMDMGGDMGSYALFRHGKTDIGGMMRQGPGMPGPDHPFWLPYFACDSVEAAIIRVKEAGGQVFHGPHEVPGGIFIMVGKDPQGALLALAGPK